MFELDAAYPLLGEVKNTPYGRIRVYYAGTRPELVSRTPVSYYLLGGQQSLITGEQVANSREVWATDLFPAASGRHSNDPNELLAELEPYTIYALKVELKSVDVSAKAQPVVTVSDRATQQELGRIVLNKEKSNPAVNVFKTSGNGLIDIRVQQSKSEGPGGESALRRIVISEIR